MIVHTISNRLFRALIVFCVFMFSVECEAGMAPPMLNPSSGNNQTGQVNSTLAIPLVVNVDCSLDPPSPPPCGDISWVSSDPGDSFSPNPSATSGPTTAALSSTTLTLSSNAGMRTITATGNSSSSGDGSTNFTIIGIAGQPPMEPTVSEEVQVQAMQANRQTAGVIGITSTAVQTGISTVTRHQINLHGGENAGPDFSGLIFEIDGNTLSLGDIQKWMGVGQGGGAGDDSSIFGDKVGVFVVGNFSFGDHDRTSRESGFDFDILGTTVGADYRLSDRLFLGAAFQYAATDTDYDRSGGGLDIDGYGIMLYSSYNQPGSFYLDGLLRYGWSDYELDRNFSIGGTPQKARADYDGTDYSLSVSGGYELVFSGLSVQPYARFEYIAVDIDSYREKANSAAAAGSLLAVNQQSQQSFLSALGARASYAISTGYGVFVPALSVEWLHEYKNNRRTVNSSLINSPATPVISATTDNPDRNYLNLGAGVTAVFAQGFSGFLNYEALLGNQYLTQHTVNLGMRMEF